MGCVASNGETKKNTNIEKDLGKDKKVNKNMVKLLLIGAGDSGKTTLRKQMRNIYGAGFDQASREASKDVIFENIISGARQIMGYVVKDEFDNDHDKEKKVKEIFGESGLRVYNESKKADIKDLSEENVNDIKWLWNQCPAFKESFAKRTEYHLQDCFTNFMESLVNNYPEWGGKAWVPSIDDCVRARVRTSGITEESFEIDNVTFKMFDCGGQRAERKKWIHFFDNVTAVIFVASLSEYDLYLFEDHTVSRLKESLELFSDMCNSKYFKEVPMILFLNKRDLFEQKYMVDKV